MKSKPCPRCRERGADVAGDNLVAFDNGHWHCFACNKHIFPEGFERFKKHETVRAEKSLNLPNDLTTNIPTEPLKWLLKHGLPYSYWSDKILWSEQDSRLIFKIGTPVEFYQGRYFGEDNKRKWYCYGNAHKTAHIFGNPDTSKSIILVEDLISAHKVSQVNATIPLFGTNIFDSVINVLRLYKKPVKVWLDKDQNGNIIKKCNKINMLTGLTVEYLFTSLDPKEIDFNTIKELL